MKNKLLAALSQVLMTTIAFDGTLMAADSQITTGNMKYFGERKIFRSNGSIIGTSGDRDLGLMFIKWHQGLEHAPTWPDTIKGSTEFTALEVDKHGRAFLYFDNGVKEPVTAPWAIGSGREIAIAAMRCGKTAPEAVELAKELDIYTGGPVFVEKVGE